ncbi:MAG: MMPL family transporter [Opitutales bacterium]
MWRVFTASYRYAPAIIAVTTLLTALAFTQLGQLQVDVSADALMPRQSPAIDAYDAVRNTFGSDKLVSIYVRDPDLFSPEKLRRLARLHRALVQLPEVQRAQDLFSVSNIARTADGIHTGPLFNSRSIPDDPALIADKKRQALNNPLLIRTVLSPEGDATLINLFLRDPGEFLESTDTAAAGTGETAPPDPSDLRAYDRQVYDQVEAILNGTLHPGTEVDPIDFREGFERIFQVGAPALQVWMSTYIFDDQKVLLPAACAILVLLIGFSLGSIQAAFIPILNAFIATAWMLGVMGLLGLPVNMLNSIIPALLLIIGATEDIHLLVEFKEIRHAGRRGIAVFKETGRQIGLTLFLTGLTTTLGFAATGLADLAIMRDFGITAAVAMASRLVISLCFLPAFLRYASPDPKPDEEGADSHRDPLDRLSGLAATVTRWIMDGILKKRTLTILIAIAIAVICIRFIPQIRLSNDLIGFLRPDSPIVEKLNTVSEDLSGSKVLYLVLKGPAGTFREVDNLRRLQDLTADLEALDAFDTVTSLSEYLALLNREFKDGTDQHYRVPDSDFLAAQFLMLFGPGQLDPYIDAQFSQANIQIRCNINDSSRLLQVLDKVEALLAGSEYRNFNYELTGKSVLVARSVEEIAVGQAASLGVVVGILFLIVTLLFISVKCGILVVLSNLLPVFVLFGVMGALDIPLNVGTCMVAAITVGISVDDTLHLMVRYNRQLKKVKKELPAIAAALRSEVIPVLITSIGLAGGFLVLGFSSFTPVLQFGLLSALVILMAVVSDLILTPVLLSTTRLITIWDLISFQLRKALLEKSPLFEGMRSWQAKRLILTANLQEVPAGTQLIREGDMGDIMYVVIEGKLEVSKGTGPDRLRLAELVIGDALGEIALVAKSRRTADVRTVEDSRLLALDWETLMRLNRFAPYLSSRFFLNLSRILGHRLVDSLHRIDTMSPFTNDPKRRRGTTENEGE